MGAYHAVGLFSLLRSKADATGTEWEDYAPSADKEKSFHLLDEYLAAGGTTIDTANGYQVGSCVKRSSRLQADVVQSEQSEKWIGEWMSERGVRDRMVVATKYTTEWVLSISPRYNGRAHRVSPKKLTRSFTSHAIGKNESANLAGNHKKSLHVSLRRSLEKLQTDYVGVAERKVAC